METTERPATDMGFDRDDRGIYVNCAGYCGKRIYEKGAKGKKQHDPECGAPDDEVAALDEMLTAAHIKAAAFDGTYVATEVEYPIAVECPSCHNAIKIPGDAGHAGDCDADTDAREVIDAELALLKARAANDVEPVANAAGRFVCSCKEPFLTWESLAEHQQATGHEGCATEDAEIAPVDEEDDDDEVHAHATGERTIKGDVDGGAARIHHGTDPAQPPPTEKQKSLAHLWSDPMVDSEFVYELQARIDNEGLTIGGTTAGKACIGKMVVVDPEDHAKIEIGCPHRPVLRTVRKNECNLDHTHTETLEQACLIHACTAWGGGIPAAGNGPLFG